MDPLKAAWLATADFYRLLSTLLEDGMFAGSDAKKVVAAQERLHTMVNIATDEAEAQEDKLESAAQDEIANVGHPESPNPGDQAA